MLPIAMYAPFFRLRVDTSLDRYALYTTYRGIRLVIHSRSPMSRLRRAAARLTQPGPRTMLRTQCNFCRHCTSLTLAHAYSYEDLSPLYRDYRSARYNEDRGSVEPGYRAIAHRVGQDPIERQSRNDGVAAFLMPDLELAGRGKALDLGGSDGKFIPLPVIQHFEETHIVDTSDATIDDVVRELNVRKVPRPEAGAYNLIMCMHVLEHVSSPRDFVIEAMRNLQAGGLLYLEVPIEFNPALAAQFDQRLVDGLVTIHEHINQFSIASVSALIGSIGALRLVKSESAMVDCGWSKGMVGRYLAQRVA